MSNADLPREGRGSCIHSRIVRPLTRMQLNCKVQTFMCVFVESVHICVPMCMHVCVCIERKKDKRGKEREIQAVTLAKAGKN